VVFAIFVLECIFKLIGIGRLYFRNFSDLFDFAIIILAILDFALESVPGLQVFRTFRLVSCLNFLSPNYLFINFWLNCFKLRIFKLAKTWKTMSKTLRIIGSTISDLFFIVLVMVVLVFIFAVLGNGLFKENYRDYYLDTSLLP
jgi:hypothetical protein